MLVLDSGGVSFLGERSPRALATLRALRDAGLWPPVVPTMVLVEALRGDERDASTNRFIKTCIVDDRVPISRARRASQLRSRSGTGSAVDALVVAIAEPSHDVAAGTVLTGDAGDIGALAARADRVNVEVL